MIHLNYLIMLWIIISEYARVSYGHYQLWLSAPNYTIIVVLYSCSTHFSHVIFDHALAVLVRNESSFVFIVSFLLLISYYDWYRQFQ